MQHTRASDIAADARRLATPVTTEIGDQPSRQIREEKRASRHPALLKKTPDLRQCQSIPSLRQHFDGTVNLVTRGCPTEGHTNSAADL